MGKIRRWSEQEIETLRAEWSAKRPARAIAHRLGRSLQAVYVKANKLGLPQKEQPSKIRLSQYDQTWLRLNYPRLRTEMCAMRLGISMRSCIRLARKLGIEKTAQFMKESQAFTAKMAKEKRLAKKKRHGIDTQGQETA